MNHTSLKLGANLELLFPTKLPQFEQQILTYGLNLNVPFLIGEFQLEAKYGGTQSFALRLFEFFYRIILDSPYISTYFEGGTYYMNYSSGGTNFDNLGPLFGWGLAFKIFQSGTAYFGIRSLIYEKVTTCFSGGFITNLF